MSPFVVRVECEDAYEGMARILNVARRMGFELERFAADALRSGRFRLHMRLTDPLNDPARRMCLLHRLDGLPALHGVSAPAMCEDWSAP